jgi:hypothetical protein
MTDGGGNSSDWKQIDWTVVGDGSVDHYVAP